MELSVRQLVGELLRDLERDLRHAGAVQDQRWRADLRQIARNIDAARRLHRRTGDARRRRAAKGFGGKTTGFADGPTHPLVCRGLGEDVPVTIDETQERLRLRRVHRQPASRRASEQHDPRNSFGVPRRVGQGMRA
jgi:hypothetical protein